ncbi:DNA primase, partial [Streptomyces sp. UNOC14_S4]|nr:DNA primase [Streptomyces sp. UNOC14_S4]
MGFTIGGIRDLRSGSRRRGRTSEHVTTVAEYTGLWGWDVVPGARASRSGGVQCSCGLADCPA